MGKMKDLFGDEPIEPRAFSRHTDPPTSREAARSVDQQVPHLESMVHQAIKRRGHHGATWDELHDLTGIDKASISPRFKPLRRRKLIRAKTVLVDGTLRKVARPGKSGRGQIVWIACEEIADEQRESLVAPMAAVAERL